VSAMDLIRLSLFALGSVVSLVVSWRALFNIRSHGFFRFVAWEAILGLIALNLPWWFDEPLAIRQLFSWTLLVLTLIVLWPGVAQLQRSRTATDRPDSDLYELERTGQLITTGIYRYVRHPIYSSLLYLAGGAFLKHISWPTAVVLVVAVASLIATAVAEERECVRYFGAEYRTYMKQTRRFIPFIF
jgi:protein-S-isoprenylcysteine O-methyltransferase Ste14